MSVQVQKKNGGEKVGVHLMGVLCILQEGTVMVISLLHRSATFNTERDFEKKERKVNEVGNQAF